MLFTNGLLDKKVDNHLPWTWF